MIDILLEIANRLERRVEEFETFPRTQATDAMKGLGTDIVKIIRETVDDAGAPVTDGEGGNLNDRIESIVNNVVDGLFGSNKQEGK